MLRTFLGQSLKQAKISCQLQAEKLTGLLLISAGAPTTTGLSFTNLVNGNLGRNIMRLLQGMDQSLGLFQERCVNLAIVPLLEQHHPRTTHIRS
jgi:hypothetical protein